MRARGRKEHLPIDSEDFPGGPVVKNLPASAGPGVGSVVQEDFTCHSTTKSMFHNKRSHQSEKATHCK